jgi:hypothetical protein
MNPREIKAVSILCILLAIFHLKQLHQNALPVLVPSGIIMPGWESQKEHVALVNASEQSSSARQHYQYQYLFLKQYERSLEESFFVELDHCSLRSINWTSFLSWASPILAGNKARVTSSPPLETFDNQTVSKIQEEWMLELLELYATHEGLCDFEKYRIRIKKKSRQIHQAGKQLQQVISQGNEAVPARHARIAFVIIAFQDAVHLKRLIQAIHMPHHIVVIHLDESTNLDFEKEVDQIIKPYSNVVVAKFGTIVYKTDSVSRINLQLMDWLVNDLQLPYDYHMVIGGAVYPLHSASEMSQQMYNSSTNVWLGELTHNGQRVQKRQWGLLRKKRLVATSSKAQAKVGNLFEPPQEWIRNIMKHKSVSGNQAVYSRAIVQQMLSHPQVLELFALAKYGCCCCIEERIWIAAMNVLGNLEEAKRNKGMFQVWGGDSQGCNGSMQNAVLDLNETRCFTSEDPDAGGRHFYGNEMWDRLVAAKKEGILFARKFRSSHKGSAELLQNIREQLHGVPK